MGTNYYHITEETRDCPTCGTKSVVIERERHIGKSSTGWCFALHVYPEEEIHDLEDWERLWGEGGEIRDEYSRTTPSDVMLSVITERPRISAPRPSLQWYEENHAAPGPEGLARHRIDRHCIAHGEGTWDLLVGEFS